MIGAAGGLLPEARSTPFRGNQSALPFSSRQPLLTKGRWAVPAPWKSAPSRRPADLSAVPGSEAISIGSATTLLQSVIDSAVFSCPSGEGL